MSARLSRANGQTTALFYSMDRSSIVAAAKPSSGCRTITLLSRLQTSGYLSFIHCSASSCCPECAVVLNKVPSLCKVHVSD